MTVAIASKAKHPMPLGSADPLGKLLAICIFAGTANASLVAGPAIASQLALQFRLTPEQIGLYFSMEYTGYILAGIGSRWLLPRFNWRGIALIALAGAVAGNIATIPALSYFPALLAVRLSTASCSAILSILALATATQCVNSGRAVSLHIMGQLAAGVAGLAGFPFLFERFGVAAYFGVVILLFAALTPAVRYLAAGREGKPTAIERSHVKLTRNISWLRHPCVLLFYIALGGIWTFAGHIASTAGIAPVNAGRILSAATFVGVIGAAVAAVIGGHGNLRLPIFGGFGLLVAGAAGLLHVGSELQFIVGIVAIKFAWSFALPFAIALIGKLDTDGRMVAEITVIAGLGLAVGPSTAGYILQSTSNYFWMIFIETLALIGSSASIIVMYVFMNLTKNPEA